MKGETIQAASFSGFLAARLPWTKRLIPLVQLAQLLVGCAHYPINAPLAAYDTEHGYRLGNQHDADNSGSLLAVLTNPMAARAALAYGVLDQPGKTPILMHGTAAANACSNKWTSGGSYNAA